MFTHFYPMILSFIEFLDISYSELGKHFLRLNDHPNLETNVQRNNTHWALCDTAQ